MIAGIKEILIITTKEHQISFQRLLGDGSKWGIKFDYAIQDKPNGISEAFIIGEDFIGSSSSALILGDNLFHGTGLKEKIMQADQNEKGATIFAYQVGNPFDYGVVEFSEDKKVISIEEKPKDPKSNFAVTGLYFYDNTVIERAKNLHPSSRNELEITSLNNSYLREGLLNVQTFGRGMAWLDTGTFDSLHEASSYIKTLENRQGLKVGCPEEIAWRSDWISDSQLIKIAKPLLKSGYGSYLKKLIKTNKTKTRFL